MMLTVHQLLILHQNTHHLRERGDLAVLHAHNTQQFKHNQNQKHRDAQQHHRGLFDVRGMCEILNAPRPDCQEQER